MWLGATIILDVHLTRFLVVKSARIQQGKGAIGVHGSCPSAMISNVLCITHSLMPLTSRGTWGLSSKARPGFAK